VCWSSRRALSVTCHYRANPALEPQVTALAREVAATTGLVARSGQKSVELLPDSCGQGHVIRNWAAGLRAACYLGDDLGDLSAFAALDQLAARGIATTRIAVRSDEAPAELLQAADMISTPLRAPPSCCRRCYSRRDGAMRAPPHCGNLFAAP
jgi:trehalose 6-phosphate phosphatase